MTVLNSSVSSVHIFCRVVDNYGDVGVCWRMARQMREEHALQVTLWIDDLQSFHVICHAVSPVSEQQTVRGVLIRYWSDDAFPEIAPDMIPDLVIEGFGCTLPDCYLMAMAKRNKAPVWLNVEYLSAEDWVEGCHELVSVHPTLPLKKYFYFPGFTDKTGGLLMDQTTLKAKQVFDADKQQRLNYLKRRGIPVQADTLYIFLFCYPKAPVQQLLTYFSQQAQQVVVIIPEHTAEDEVAAFCGKSVQAGTVATRGQLTLCCIPFSDQTDFDLLLWSCDINFVRGEDSFVRAQWAGKPFIWHIYPQDEKAHMVKLDAFLDRYVAGMPEQLQHDIHRLWYAWNGEATPDISLQDVRQLIKNCSNWQQYSQHWMQNLLKNGDLVTNIISFCRNKLE